MTENSGYSLVSNKHWIDNNTLNRRFSKPYPLQKLISDIKEFKFIDGEKLYLSPIFDLNIAYGINKRPKLGFEMKSLHRVLRLP